MLEQLVDHLKPAASHTEVLPREEGECGDSGNSALFLHVDSDCNAEETFAFRVNGLRDVINSGEMIATYRWKIFWMNSKLCKKSESSVPPETYFLLMRQKNNNKFLLFVPLIDGDTLFSLEGEGHTGTAQASGEGARLLLHAFNNKKGRIDEAANKRALLVSEGADLFALVVYSMSIVKQIAVQQISLYSQRPPDPKDSIAHATSASPPLLRGPAFINYLAWSTWDAFYTGVSSDKVLKGLRSFSKAGVTPRTIIIDDGWQASSCVDLPNTMQWTGRLESFEANYKFDGRGSSGLLSIETETIDCDIEISGWASSSNNGNDDDCCKRSLAELVSHMKDEYGVKQVLLWHTLTGYWAGVHGSAFEERYDASLAYSSLSTSVCRMSPVLSSEIFQSLGVGLVSHKRATAFFDDYHKAMRAMGVDGVKVDAQAIVSALRPADSSMSSNELVFRFQLALMHSVQQNFCTISEPYSYPLIHCMCHSWTNIFAILGLYGNNNGAPEVVIRASDDYWPGDDRSHGPHLNSNLLNSLVLSSLGVVDWDMFQSHSSAGAGGGRTSTKVPYLHACARAISGGPVTLSDRPLEHCSQLLARIALSSGRVPLCTGAAMPVEGWLFADPARSANTPLLMQNINGQHSKVAAAFNVLGSYLENDSDNFVFMRPEDIDWRDASVQAYACDEGRISCNAEGGNAALLDDSELHRDPVFREAAQIRFSIDESDLRGVAWGRCITHRLSDGALADAHSAEIFLGAIFDCDIITFARKLTLGNSCQGIYFSAVGDLSLLNPGGAVLRVSVGAESDDGVVVVTVEVLAGAVISIVTNAAAASIVVEHSSDPFLQDKDFLCSTGRVIGGGARELLLSPIPCGGGAESVVVSLAMAVK